MSLHHRVGLYTLCAFAPRAVSSPLRPRAPADPGRLRRLMEVEVRDGEWSSLTVHPCGQPHFMLFGPLCPGLGVKCQSGALEGPAQWSGGSHHEDRLTLPFESEIERGWGGGGGESKRERESLGSETFAVMVIGRSVLERQAAVLSKSQGRRPVALQRAAQQCLSQHINNSCVLECVCIHKCVHSYSMCVPFKVHCGKTCGGFICLRFVLICTYYFKCASERACGSVCLPLLPVDDLPPPNFPDLVNMCLRVLCLWQ